VDFPPPKERFDSQFFLTARAKPTKAIRL
jgi:hypothetical protein